MEVEKDFLQLESIVDNILSSEKQKEDVITNRKKETNEIPCSHSCTIKTTSASTTTTTNFTSLYCKDCGKQIFNDISNQKDWRTYDKNTLSNDRCNTIRSILKEEKGLLKDISSFNFDKKVVELANHLYLCLSHSPDQVKSKKKFIEAKKDCRLFLHVLWRLLNCFI